MSNHKQINISIIRVLSMISIIIGHWLTMRNVNHFQYGAIGVEIFFFISGYLYSDKIIKNNLSWIKNRFKRIIVPYWIVLTFVILLRLFFSFNICFEGVFISYMNLQGVDRIFRDVSFPGVIGMGQTWFISVLMICYLLMLILKNNPQIERRIRLNAKWYFFLTIVIQVILSYIHIDILRPLCFFYGYFSKKETLNMNSLNYSKLSLFVLLFTIARFFSHLFYDNTVFYDYIVFGWSFIITAYWIIVSTTKITHKYSFYSERIINSKFWRVLDCLSYPLFLVHYVFTSGEFAVINWINCIYIQGIVFVLLIMSFSTILFVFTQRENLLDN